MKPTIAYIQQKFDHYNRHIFAGKLPKLPIELSNAKSFVGACVFKKRRGKDGKVEKFDFRLRISTRMDLPETEVEDTIIHEMIHYYIGVNQLVDSSSHGTLFRHMMNTINERFGRHITVSHKSTAEQKEQAVDTTPRWHVVATVRLENGKLGVKVISRIVQRILTYYNRMSASKDVKCVELYMTNHPYFNRFPNSGALNAVFADEAIVYDSLKGAERLLCNGTDLIRTR